MNRKRGYITLLLTAKCNLSCIYCYEKKDERRMSYDTAKEIIDEFIQSTDYTEYVIDFFGGEPFLEFELIKNIHNYVITTYPKLLNSFIITTNGTLVHGEIKQWLLENDDVLCTLSLDGNRDSHNINRCNSYDDIDINFFLDKYHDVEIKMTISPQTLRNMSESVIHCHKQGFKINCNLAFNDFWNESHIPIFAEELEKLLNYYKSNPNVEPCSLIGRNISDCAYYYRNNIYLPWCDVGNMPTFDSKKHSYPCQYFAFLNGEYMQTIDIISRNKIQVSLLPEKCQNCVIHPICPTCYAFGYEAYNNCFGKSDTYCSMMKILMKCRSIYYVNLHNLKKINLFSEENTNLLNTIILIQEHLHIDI